jgi:hypothetical protein
MADDLNVSVKFGATTDELEPATKRAAEAVNSVKESVDSLRETLVHVAEAVGIAFSIDAIKGFVEGMAELGLQTERIGATLGLSNQQVVELSGFARLTGSSIESLSSGIERMSLNVQRSTRDATNPAAQSLKALGLNAHELIGLPADQWFTKLSEAVAKFNPSLNLTNQVMAIGGRGVAQMLPALLQGAEGFNRFKEEVDKASEGLASAVPGMADTHEKLTLLSLSAQSLGARIFSTLKPAIDAVVTALTNWLQSIHGDTIRDAVNSVGNATITIAQSVALFFVGADETWRKFIASINAGLPALHTAVGASLLLIGQAGPALQQFKAALAGVGNSESFAKIETDASAARDKINDLAKSMRDAFDASVPKSGTGAAMAADFAEIQKGVQDTIAAYQKLNATSINMGGGDALKGQMEQLQGSIKVADEQYRMTAEHLGAELKMHELTNSQETAALLAALNKRMAAEETAIDGELLLYARGTAGYEKAIAERRQLEAKYQADRQKITDQAAEREAQQWKAAADTIAGAFNSQLKGLLAGTTTWSKAMKSISADLVLKFLEDQVKATAEFIANKARELSTTVLTEGGKTSATTAGAALRSAAEVASGEVSILQTIANAIKAIFAGAGQTAAGVSAAVAPEAGPAAPAIGAAAGAATAAAAFGIAQFDVGTDYVMRSGLAVIHQGEQIKPAAGSGPYTGKNDGGGSGAIRSMLSAHVDTMKGMLGAHARAMASLESEVFQMRRAVARATR